MLRCQLILCCLTLTIPTGCGKPAVKDPLAGVGGYKLVYRQKDQREIDPWGVETALRKSINATWSGEVVVNGLKDGCEILLPGASEKTVADVKRAIAVSNVLQLRIVAAKGNDDQLIALAEGGQTPVGVAYVAFNPKTVAVHPTWSVVTTPGGKSMLLILEGAEPVDASHIDYAEVGKDEDLRPCIRASLNAEGERRIEALTNANRGRQLAIIVDGTVVSAPTILSTVNRHLQITGNLASEEIQTVVASLRGARTLGCLEPQPISETKVAAGSEK